MKPYGVKKEHGCWIDYVRKSKEVSANPKLKNAKKRLCKALKAKARKQNTLTLHYLAN